MCVTLFCDKSLFLVRMVDELALNFVYQPPIFRVVVKLKLGSKDSGAIVLYFVHLCAVSLTEFDWNE